MLCRIYYFMEVLQMYSTLSPFKLVITELDVRAWWTTPLSDGSAPFIMVKIGCQQQAFDEWKAKGRSIIRDNYAALEPHRLPALSRDELKAIFGGEERLSMEVSKAAWNARLDKEFDVVHKKLTVSDKMVEEKFVILNAGLDFMRNVLMQDPAKAIDPPKPVEPPISEAKAT